MALVAAAGAVGGEGGTAVGTAAAAEVVGGDAAVGVGAAGGVGLGPALRRRQRVNRLACLICVRLGVGEREEQVLGVEAAVGYVGIEEAGDGGRESDAAVLAVFGLVLDLEPRGTGSAVARADLDDGAGDGEHPGHDVEVAGA